MKLFKTERIIYFKTKYSQKIEPNEIITKSEESSTNRFICIKENYSQKFLSKKVCHFRVDKYDSLFLDQIKGKKEGKWTLKEHIQFLQALEKFGVNWKKISDYIPSRTSIQIRSHSQKFYKKLKECKDTELGIDFTSRHINNINDMISHIKSVNKDYNVFNLFLYLSEKCYPNKIPQNPDKVNNIDINNILRETININNNDKNDSLFNNNIKENIIDKEVNINKQIINNNIINTPINNILFNNINYLSSINNFEPLIQLYLNHSVKSNNINNNTILQNSSKINLDIVNDNFINNNSKYLLDKNYIFNYPINNF